MSRVRRGVYLPASAIGFCFSARSTLNPELGRGGYPPRPRSPETLRLGVEPITAQRFAIVHGQNDRAVARHTVPSRAGEEGGTESTGDRFLYHDITRAEPVPVDALIGILA